MITLERKVDMILRYIATDDEELKGEMKEAIAEMLKFEAEAASTTPTPDIDDMIVECLKNIGMPQHLVGYKYAISAIKMCIAKPGCIKYVIYELYSNIAAMYNTTPSRVERGIRHAICVCFDRGNIDFITSFFGNTIDLRSGKLTNSEFIAAVVNEITRQMKKREL